MKNYKDVKIAVYAICKNESKFIDGWLKNMWCGGNGADGVYILDTGSDDGTIARFNQICEEIKTSQDWLTIKQKKYEQWRFDTARNDNMDMIPSEKYDAFYCIDLDERVISDFWDDLRKMVALHPNFERIYYMYAWSHDEQNGEPKRYFWYDKIHGVKGWRWQFPVHESLTYDGQEGYKGKYYLDSNKIYLHHYPDNTKSRGPYLGLLELRAKEYPDDLYGLYYLSREYGFYGQIENALKIALRLYCRLLKNNPTDSEKVARDDMCMLPSLCAIIGDTFAKMGVKDDAEYYYRKSIKYGPQLRDGYIKLSQLLAYSGRATECYEILRTMKKRAVKTNDWRVIDYYWREWKVYQIIADAKCWEQKYDEAKSYFERALVDLKTETDQREAANEGFYSDYEWLKSHHSELFVSSIEKKENELWQ